MHGSRAGLGLVKRGQRNDGASKGRQAFRNSLAKRTAQGNTTMNLALMTYPAILLRLKEEVQIGTNLKWRRHPTITTGPSFNKRPCSQPVHRPFINRKLLIIYAAVAIRP